jgi:hypothetical protein
MKIAGIDVSRGKIVVAILSEVPNDIRRAKHKIYKIKADAEGIQQLLALDFDGAVIEPTGGHYAAIWVHHLELAGRVVRYVGHQAVTNYRKSWRVENKSDDLDAIALACYGLERWHRPAHFIQGKGAQIRELWLQLKHYDRAQNPIINRLRQQLCAEWPEVAERQVTRRWLSQEPPGLWRFIAGETGRTTNKWATEQAQSIGIGLSQFANGLARQICEIQRQELIIERQLQHELERPEYKIYLQVFAQYEIKEKVACALLGAVYPFEKFLDERGFQISEYLETANGRSRRNRSLGAFKLSCGIGTVLYQSGNYSGKKAGGRADIRSTLWLWCKTSIVLRHDDSLPAIAKLRDYYENGSTQIVQGEEKHFEPGVRSQKMMRVVRRMVEMLYKDLYKNLTPNRSNVR